MPIYALYAILKTVKILKNVVAALKTRHNHFKNTQRQCGGIGGD